jgi:hypothetical protein
MPDASGRQAGEADQAFDPDPVNGHELLEKLAALPISKWSYVWDGPAVRHLGPMSQDFMAAFGLGADEQKLDFIDTNGVLMVSIQALYRRLVALEAEVTRLRAAQEDASDDPELGETERVRP